MINNDPIIFLFPRKKKKKKITKNIACKLIATYPHFHSANAHRQSWVSIADAHARTHAIASDENVRELKGLLGKTKAELNAIIAKVKYFKSTVHADAKYILSLKEGKALYEDIVNQIETIEKEIRYKVYVIDGFHKYAESEGPKKSDKVAIQTGYAAAIEFLIRGVFDELYKVEQELTFDHAHPELYGQKLRSLILQVSILKWHHIPIGISFDATAEKVVHN